jgi:hypothetical protein
MGPVAHVAGVDEAAELLAAADELAAADVRAVRPLDRELGVVGDELQR